MLVKEGKNSTLSYTCRKRKCTLASLIISIFIYLLQNRNFFSLRVQHLFPSILGAKKFPADVLHIIYWLERICVSISVIQHFYTALKWIEFPFMEKRILNHMFGITSRVGWDVLHYKSEVTHFAGSAFSSYLSKPAQQGRGDGKL